MKEETFVIPGKLRRKLAGLEQQFGNIGFNRIEYSRDRLVVEKLGTAGLYTEAGLRYRIVFGKKSIEFVYATEQKVPKRKTFLELLPLLLNVLILSQDYYTIELTGLFVSINSILTEMSQVVGKDVIELSQELDELKAKHAELKRKYEELVRSSEENARILLEVERRRDELSKRVGQLERMSDESLKEELFKWIKLHGGAIDVAEFSKVSSVSTGRVEEGLEMLIKEGYIKRRG